MKNFRSYTIILQPEPDGGFTVVVPSLPGCVTYGKDLSEARTMAHDAIAGYIASLEKHDESVPSDDASLITTIQLGMRQTNKSSLYA